MHVKVEHSAGGVVLRSIGGRVHALLIRDMNDNWGLPKGHIEPGEGPGEAAVREVCEETGLTQVEIGGELGSIDWYFRHDGHVIHKFCTFFVMWAPHGEVAPARDEGIDGCAWIGLDEALARIAYTNAREMLERARAMIQAGELPTVG